MRGVSILTPTRGATSSCSSMRSVLSGFNPRSHTGSDITITINKKSVEISIRAPSRGATPFAVLGFIKYNDFNPRSLTGSDLKRPPRCPKSQKFQSALPHGERQAMALRDLGVDFISILAPTRGATLVIHNKSALQLFQSSLPHGERQKPEADEKTEADISILAPTRGATVSSNSQLYKQADFNPRSHTGSDSSKIYRQMGTEKFQSSLPHGERQCSRLPVCRG